MESNKLGHFTVMKHVAFILLLLLVCSSGFACQQRTGLAHERAGFSKGSDDAKVERAPDAVPPAALKLPLVNPRIVVFKNKRRLELYSDGKLVRTYRVALGLNPVPPKHRQGDHATPEGDYYVFVRNDKSAFYLSLGVSYPNVEDAERGLRDGLISRGQRDAIVNAIKRKARPLQNTRLGGDIFIHGSGASSDWTWGCVALENADIKELFDAVPVGTPVTIKP